jgi:pyrimidine operon attenuation protein/uracil phosphoribosyltransferase
MEQPKNTILDKDAIRKKIERMAWQIYEDHAGEKALVFAGIRDKGHIVARCLGAALGEISKIQITQIEVEIDKSNPMVVTLSDQHNLNGSVIILVDDVANSGRTLLYAMKPFLDYLPSAIRLAVLIDRRHKAFPICPDYSGYSLSTTLQDHIIVEMKDEQILGAYLQ